MMPGIFQCTEGTTPITALNHIPHAVPVILEYPRPDSMSSCDGLRVDGLNICCHGVKTGLLKSSSSQTICVVDVRREISWNPFLYELSACHVFVNICQRLDPIEVKALDEQFRPVN